MNIKTVASLCLPLLAVLAGPLLAQDTGRVMPASLPLPLPGEAPMPPDVLRAKNPNYLTMTGTWRFQLTHGKVIAGAIFEPSPADAAGILASSSQGDRPPENAFDGSQETRWCASDASFPQWIAVDLGQVRKVTGVKLTWERGNQRYQFRIEGRKAKEPWTTLADQSNAPGAGDGAISIAAGDVRYLRLTVLGCTDGWASVREFQPIVSDGGNQVAWHPALPKASDESEAVRDAFASLRFDDSAWDDVPVPSNWELLGYSLPTYNSVDNTVGLYRRWVTLPADWAGKNIYWHFDGSLDGTEIFINGVKAGYHESGYTAFDVDLTGLVNPGQRNLFAVRVSKQVPSYDCETGDFQAMGGIYRETALIAVPPTHISDITVRTPLDENYQNAVLNAQVQVQGDAGTQVELTGQLTDASGKPTGVTLSGKGTISADGATVSMSAPVKSPALWSAEKPNLYYLVLELQIGGKTLERVEQRFGFRQIDIKDKIVLWNGKPIKCTGSCRHDFWADKGFALSEENWEKDVSLMKEANINAIRTSHYNHAARFLELAEEKGLYILDEVPFCWIGDSVNDPSYAPFLMQRAQETMARDKNRPCVIAWSLGNENAIGTDSHKVIDMVLAADPTRPAFLSCTGPWDVKNQSWEDDHYPDPGSVNNIAKKNWPANFSEHPHIFYQKETQDYDPGASDLWSETLIKTWGKLWKDPTILGSFIWEWQCQGIADKNPNTTQDFWYGKDHLRQENNKGIVDAYRNPKPEWWIVKMAYSPVVVDTRVVTPTGETCVVPLINHYSFTNLNELNCQWSALKGTTVLQSGVKHLECAPMKSIFPAFPAPAGMTALRLDFQRADGSSVVAANLHSADAPLPAPPPGLSSGAALKSEDNTDTLTVSNDRQEIVFDKQTGTIKSWRVNKQSLLVGGPVLNLGEAKESGEKDFYRAKFPPVTDGGQVTATPGVAGAMQVVTTSNVLTERGGTTLGTLKCTYDIQPNAEIHVAWRLTWTSADKNLWEEGVKFSLPAEYTTMKWLRDSYFLDYPADHIGAPTGTCNAGDVSFRASKRKLHWMTLTDKSGAGLALLQDDEQPLVGRAQPGTDTITLLASREVAGPRDFSGSWVAEHDIHARQGKELSGAFILRAIAP